MNKKMVFCTGLLCLAGAGIFLFATSFYEFIPSQPLEKIISEKKNSTEQKNKKPVDVSSKEIAKNNTPENTTNNLTDDQLSLELQPSHPITADHERLYQENKLIGELFGAIDANDYLALRELNSLYRENFPMANDMQTGIDIIANCMESKTDNVKISAQDYYNQKVASRLRRYVRRYCFN